MESSAFVSSFLPTPYVRSSFTGATCARPRRPATLTEPRVVPVMTASSDDDGAKPSVARRIAAAALAALLTLPIPLHAFAATSSGRIGGSHFSSSSSIAARSGGRLGGSSFRRTAPPPRSSGGGYRGGYSGYGGYSGGLFSPVIPVTPFYFSPFSPFGAPVVSFGGGGLVSALVVASAAAVILRGVAWRGTDDEHAGSPDITVVTLKVGLLASATRVRDALDSLAVGGDTNTARGLARVLGDAAVALLRAGDYWVSAAGDVSVARGGDAEGVFNETAVRERSKLARETLSNVAGTRRSAPAIDTRGAAPEEFVVVTLVVATDGSLARKLPRRIRSSDDVRKTLNALGSVGADEMQALEVLWAPQQRGDSLSRAEMLLDHPELREL